MSDAYEHTTRRLKNAPICSLVQDLLPLYLEQETSEASQTMIRDHIAQCEHCAGFLAGARSVRQQFKHAPINLPNMPKSINSSSWLHLALIVFLCAISIFGFNYGIELAWKNTLGGFVVMLLGLIGLERLGANQGNWGMTQRFLLLVLYGSLLVITRGAVFGSGPLVGPAWVVSLGLMILIWKLNTLPLGISKQATHPNKDSTNADLLVTFIVTGLIIGVMFTISTFHSLSVQMPLLLILLLAGVIFNDKIIQWIKILYQTR